MKNIKKSRLLPRNSLPGLTMPGVTFHPETKKYDGPSPETVIKKKENKISRSAEAMVAIHAPDLISDFKKSGFPLNRMGVKGFLLYRDAKEKLEAKVISIARRDLEKDLLHSEYTFKVTFWRIFYERALVVEE